MTPVETRLARHNRNCPGRLCRNLLDIQRPMQIPAPLRLPQTRRKTWLPRIIGRLAKVYPPARLHSRAPTTLPRRSRNWKNRASRGQCALSEHVSRAAGVARRRPRHPRKIRRRLLDRKLPAHPLHPLRPAPPNPPRARVTLPWGSRPSRPPFSASRRKLFLKDICQRKFPVGAPPFGRRSKSLPEPPAKLNPIREVFRHRVKKYSRLRQRPRAFLEPTDW